MARNMAIDFIRKHRQEELTALLNDIEEGPSEEEKGPGRFYKEAAPDEVEQAVIQDMTIKEALAKLKPSERQVVSLKVLGDLTFKEIAQVMGIPWEP